MLENFRTQKIIWDRANKKIFEKIEANSGDSNGRKLVVQVINQGVIENLFGTTLSLGWKHRKGAKGLDAFNVVDASKGIFEIYYTTEMLSNIGNIEASLILIDSTSRIESSTFTISIRPSTVDDSSVQSENSFTTLTEALVTVNQYDQKIDDLKRETTAQLAQKVTHTELDAQLATLLDGGPSIFMNTLSELQSTYPNGVAGVALVRETDPAKIYVWNGSAWEDFGDYHGIEIKDGTVTTSKMVNDAVTSSKRTRLGELPLVSFGASGGIFNFDTSTYKATFTGAAFIFTRNRRYQISLGTEIDLSSVLATNAKGAAIYFDVDTQSFYTRAQHSLSNITESSILFAVVYVSDGKWFLRMNGNHTIDSRPIFKEFGDMLGDFPLITMGQSGGNINLNTESKKIVFEGAAFIFHKDKRYTIPIGTEIDFSHFTGSGNAIYFDTETQSFHVRTQTNLTGIPQASLLIGVVYTSGGKWDLIINADYTIDGKPKFMPYGENTLGELPPIIKGKSGGLIDLDTVDKTLTFDATGFLFHQNKRYTIPSGTIVDFSSAGDTGIVIYYDLATGTLYHKGQTRLTGITETSVIIAIAYAVGSEWNLLMNADYTINGKPKFMPYGETAEAGALPYQFPVEKLTGDFPESDLVGVGEVGNPFDGVNDDYSLVYSLFDGLMSNNPNYITREQIGLSTNDVPIYCYHFKPEVAPIKAGPLLKPYPKVLMDSSIHGGERLGTYTLYFLFKRICEDWQTDKGLEYLRHYVNFSIVPLPNPEDFTSGQYAGIDGVNVNRDFDFAWTEKEGTGPTAFSRVESQAMRDFFIANDDALLFVNIHVRGHAVTVDDQTMWLGSSDIRETPILTNTIEKMTRKWKQKYPALQNVDGQLGRITTRDASGTIKSYAHHVVGIPSILWEGFKATPTIKDFEGKDVVDMNVNFLGETVFNIIKNYQG